MQSINDLFYASGLLQPDDKRSLLVRLPEKSNQRCLFFIHGGGWNAGNKGQWRSVAEYFCERGYVCVSAGYRLAPGHLFPAQFEDVRLAYAFVKARAEEWDFDSQKMAVWGSSAGGHLAALLATTGAEDDLGATPALSSRATRPAVAVGLCPVFSVLPEAHINIPDEVKQLLGDTPQSAVDLARLASPIERVCPLTAPFLIISGDADEVTPIEHQQAMIRALNENHVEAKLKVLPSVGHGFGYGVESDAQKQTLSWAHEFLEEHLSE